MAKNRIEKRVVADADLIVAEVQAALELADTPEANKPRNNNGATNRLASAPPKGNPPTLRRDRFKQPYGVTADEAKHRTFDEPTELLARAMLATELHELAQFKLEVRNVGRHTEQLLRLHENAKHAFSDLPATCQEWLQAIVRASFVTRFTFSSALGNKQIHAQSQAARSALLEWKKESRQCVSLGKVAQYLPRNEPFSAKTFASITPQEQLVRIVDYWSQACAMLAKAIMTVIANGVDQGPFGEQASLFSLIQWDQPNAKATYSYWTRELRREANAKTESTLLTSGSHLGRRSQKARLTTTTTAHQVRQRVHHSHSITNVERFGYVDALATPWLAIPPEIERAMRTAPAFIRPFIDVFAGNLAIEVTVAQDLDAQQIVTKESRDIALPCEPALTLFRNFVLSGWGPSQMRDELRRRSQVRLRQMRQRQIVTEKAQAKTRHTHELDQVSKQLFRPLCSLAVTVLMLASAALLVLRENAAGLHAAFGTFVLCLLVPLPYLIYSAWLKSRSRAQLRGELAALDTEKVRLAEELETLRHTPISEL